MENPQHLARALQLFSLIILAQIPRSTARPYPNGHERDANSTVNEYYQRRPPVAHPIPGVAISDWPQLSYTSAGDGWQPTGNVIQISDGQVQEPYIVYTETISSKYENSVIFSTTTGTSSYPDNWWSHTQTPWSQSTPSPDPGNSPSAATSTSTTPTSSISSSSQFTSTTAFTSLLPPNSESAISASSGVQISSSIIPTSPPASSLQSTSTSTISSTSSSITTAISAPALSTVLDSSLTSLSTSAIESATITALSNTVTGSIQTSLETSLNPSSAPFPSLSITSATSSLSLVNTATLSNVGPSATASETTLQASDIFQAIATDAPPSQISSRADYPVPTLGIQEQQQRLQTNKFYANFFLGTQAQGTWTHPYSVAWSKGSGQTNSTGLAISHIERSQLGGGGSKTDSDAGEQEFIAAPVGIQSLVLSAAELGAGTTLTTDTLDQFSVNVNLLPQAGATPIITFPVVQGMAYVTGIYNDCTPLLQSGVGIVTLTYAGAVVDGKVYKYRAVLTDGFAWLIYITPDSSHYNEASFTLLSSGVLQGPSGFGGTIQVAKVPGNSRDAEPIYDQSAGVYPTAGSITGSIQGTIGSYGLSWAKAGLTDRTSLMYALPHHVQSFTYATSNGLTDVQLVTTTKGMATAVRADSWSLTESNLPISMGFAPWTPTLGEVRSVSSDATEAIVAAGVSELSQNISEQTNSGSLYYDGKALAKFAAVAYTLNDIAGNATLAQTGLQMLEQAFALHVNNELPFPLVYDTVYGGAVSESTYISGNIGDDFGNTLYNDHHFHYGYFVYTAAVIAYLDPTWLNDANRAWVNMLVRDYANSISDDPYFPASRSFDWFHGHSWAHGLAESADGKDQESSSEDTMASYAVKMWGKISGDTNMEARGNLMLAVQARSLQHYYLYTDDNDIEPSQILGNKVAGILFENKIDHTTYFGRNPEYIEGIHMLPISPCGALTRSPQFVQEEWDTYFAEGAISPASQVQGGWRGILMADRALIDPVDSYNFFSNISGTFQLSYLDGGASQTWYLAWAAALGGSPVKSNKQRREVWGESR